MLLSRFHYVLVLLPSYNNYTKLCDRWGRAEWAISFHWWFGDEDGASDCHEWWQCIRALLNGARKNSFHEWRIIIAFEPKWIHRFHCHVFLLLSKNLIFSQRLNSNTWQWNPVFNAPDKRAVRETHRPLTWSHVKHSISLSTSFSKKKNCKIVGCKNFTIFKCKSYNKLAIIINSLSSRRNGASLIKVIALQYAYDKTLLCLFLLIRNHSSLMFISLTWIQWDVPQNLFAI